MDLIAVLSKIGRWHKRLWDEFERDAFGDAPARSESEVLRDYFSFEWLDKALGLE